MFHNVAVELTLNTVQRGSLTVSVTTSHNETFQPKQTCSHFFFISFSCPFFHFNEWTTSVSWTTLAKKKLRNRNKALDLQCSMKARCQTRRMTRIAYIGRFRVTRRESREAKRQHKDERDERKTLLCVEGNYEVEMMREKIFKPC